MGSSKTPKAPDAAKSYQQGVDVFLANLPTLLNADQQARDTYDNPSVEQGLDRQEKYGPQLINDALARLQQADPTGTAARQAQGTQVGNDLAQGYNLPADYQSQIENTVRGQQAARGNILGNGAASEEATAKGRAAIDLYQQRLSSAGTFLAGPTPEQQIINLPSVTPDRSESYTNPSAGYQGQGFALGNYQNLLAQQQLSGGANNPWVSAIGAGAKVGAAAYGAGAFNGAGGSASWFTTPSSGQGSGIFGGTG